VCVCVSHEASSWCQLADGGVVKGEGCAVLCVHASLIASTHAGDADAPGNAPARTKHMHGSPGCLLSFCLGLDCFLCVRLGCCVHQGVQLE